MRARTVNFERGKDPKETMRIGRWRQNLILDAMKKIADDFGIKEELEINEDPEYFYAGIRHKGHFFSIGINPEFPDKFIAQLDIDEYSHTSADEYPADTLEEAIQELSGWIYYGFSDM